jgi:hypothetical protein
LADEAAAQDALNATILRCMGIDNEGLTYKVAGLNARLTGVEGAKPLTGLLA